MLEEKNAVDTFGKHVTQRFTKHWW